MRAYLNPLPVTLKDLHERLADWGLEHDIEPWWGAWKAYDRSGGQTLPNAGGWLDQDTRVMAFFEFCYLLKAFHEIPETPTPTLGNDW